MSLFGPPQVITADVFAELPEKFRKRNISPERAASGRRTLYIVDSEAGCILTARAPTPGRTMFSHL